MKRVQAVTWVVAVGVMGFVVYAFVRFMLRLESDTERLRAVATVVAMGIAVAGLAWIVSALGRRP